MSLWCATLVSRSFETPSRVPEGCQRHVLHDVGHFYPKPLPALQQHGQPNTLPYVDNERHVNNPALLSARFHGCLLNGKIAITGAVVAMLPLASNECIKKKNVCSAYQLVWTLVK